jgi:hypothetical protein
VRGWTLGFCPLNTIERSLRDLIDARQAPSVRRTRANVTAQDAMAMLEPGDILIDCTGTRSVLRDHLLPTPHRSVTRRWRSSKRTAQTP